MAWSDRGEIEEINDTYSIIRCNHGQARTNTFLKHFGVKDTTTGLFRNVIGQGREMAGVVSRYLKFVQPAVRSKR